MLIEQAYQKYLQKVEKNGTNDNISTDRGRFVVLYNESTNKIIEWLLDRRSEDDVRYIQKLLIVDKKVSSSTKRLDHYDFKVPENYFDFSNVYALGSTTDCKGEKLYLFPIKEEDKNEILQDPYNKPSFLYRESPYTLSSDAVNVYADDFSIDSIFLSYYRYPNQIQLINPEDPESLFNESIEIEFDDKLVDRIISLCAGEFDINEENQRFQFQKQRVIQKV